MRDSAKATLLDLLAGLIAILAVVGVAIRSQFVGSDMRVLFGMSGVAFFLAGLARSGLPARPARLQGLIVSLPGLLGDAALIVNNGGNLGIPLAITLTSIACSIGGVLTRRLALAAPARSAGAAILLAAALGLWVGVGVPRLVAQTGYRWSARSCPRLTFRSLDGEPVSVPDPRGRVVVLAFWATWCQPCRWELPELVRVRQRFAADPRVALWAVDVGWGPESPARARAFLERRRLLLPAAFDSAFSAQALGVHALPSIAVVDGRGRLRLTHSGFDRSEDLAGRLSGAIERLAEETARGR